MNRQLQIVWRGLERSEALAEHIAGLAQGLEHRHPIDGCRVVITLGRHHHHGGRFAVKLEIGVDGKPIAVTHEGARDDAFAAVNEAFAVATHEIAELEPRRRAMLRKARTAA
jgi:hypothetical protein